MSNECTQYKSKAHSSAWNERLAIATHVRRHTSNVHSKVTTAARALLHLYCCGLARFAWQWRGFADLPPFWLHFMCAAAADLSVKGALTVTAAVSFILHVVGLVQACIPSRPRPDGLADRAPKRGTAPPFQLLAQRIAAFSMVVYRMHRVLP